MNERHVVRLRNAIDASVTEDLREGIPDKFRTRRYSGAVAREK